MRRSFRTHRFGVSHTQGFTLGWYAVPRWGTPEIRLTTLRGPILAAACSTTIIPPFWRQRDLGHSAPWRRTPHPLARSAKADPSQSLLSRDDSVGSVVLAAASSAITSLFARYGPQSVRASLSPCLAKQSATPSLPSHLNRPGRARGGHGPAEPAPETHHSKA